MAALDVNEASKLVAAALGIAAYTAPSTPMKLALTTTVGTPSAAGTEVTGGSYARQTITLNAVGTDGKTENSSEIDFTNMPDTSAASVKGVEIYDNGGRRICFGALATARTTQAGDTLSFAAGALTFTFQ